MGKREAQFTNIGSGVGTQIGFDGSTFSNQHSQIGSQLASKGANIANQFSQANLQKGFGNNAELLSGLNFPTAVGSGHIFSKQSQIGTQIGFDGSTFSNLNSQIGKQLASKGAFLSNQGSQANLQQGFGSNADLLLGLNFPSVGGSGHIFNKQSQINTQIGG